MPTIQIPTVPQAQSKLRICQGFLHVYEIERYRLELDHQQGKISEKELQQRLQEIAIDEQRLEQDIESTRLIQRSTTAA
jgi:hypothetical protein